MQMGKLVAHQGTSRCLLCKEVCYNDSTGHPNNQTKIMYNWLNTSIMFKQTRTDYFHVLHKLGTDIAYLVGTSGFCQMHFFKEGI